MDRIRRWQDLTTTQKISLVLLGTLQVSLLIAALGDLRHRSSDEINGSKTVWTILSFVNFIGPLAYFSFGRKRITSLG